MAQDVKSWPHLSQFCKKKMPCYSWIWAAQYSLRRSMLIKLFWPAINTESAVMRKWDEQNWAFTKLNYGLSRLIWPTTSTMYLNQAVHYSIRDSRTCVSKYWWRWFLALNRRHCNMRFGVTHNLHRLRKSTFPTSDASKRGKVWCNPCLVISLETRQSVLYCLGCVKVCAIGLSHFLRLHI